MNKMKRIYILLAVLLVIIAGIWGVSHMENKKEAIRVSGDSILEISPDDIDHFSFANETGDYSFSLRDDGSWAYEGDTDFPVSTDAVANALGIFEDFRADFTIEDAEDLSVYGLNDPVATISLSTADGETLIEVGALSVMDEERYVSVGDGRVYLAKHDPMDEYAGTYTDLIANDELPSVSRAESIDVSSLKSYSAYYEEEGGISYLDDDHYYALIDGKKLALDTKRVEDYLLALGKLKLSDFVTYAAGEEDLKDTGLDSPELSVSVSYEDSDEAMQTFTLRLSRDPEERAAADESAEESDDEDVTAYARVGESSIIYKITADEYETLIRAGYDDLRHQEIFWADMDEVTGFDIKLEGETYSFRSELVDDVREYYRADILTDDDEISAGDYIDIAGITDAISALTADSFTTEEPDGTLEISLTIYLDREDYPETLIELYRYDGADVLAAVDGSPVALVPRSEAVDLIEAVYEKVL